MTTILASTSYKQAAASEISQTDLQPIIDSNSVLLNQIESYFTNKKVERLDQLQPASEAMEQINSVDQLRDVSPDDWAYEALRSLVERYGCIVGYPDGTFRGNQAITRYEFAAGLNSCLIVVERLIAENATIPGEDLETIQRLAAEFEVELATLGARVDDLEGRIAIVEDNQFSTTTKLRGNLFVNLTGATAGDEVLAETVNLNTPLSIRRAGRDEDGDPIVSEITSDPQITLSYYTWLTFETSFSGEDNLVTQLVAGNGISPANFFTSAGLYNTFGVPFTDQTGAPSAGSVAIRELFYDFPVGEQFRITVGPRINWYRYFDNNAFTFFLTGASSFNASGGTLVNPIDRGSGAVVAWNLNERISLKAAYLAESTEFLPAAVFNTASDPEKGFFNATNTITVGVDIAATDTANIRLLYTRANLDNNQPILDAEGNVTGFGVGGATGEPIYGIIDDGFGGTIGDAPADTFLVNFDWLITEKIGIFGRYSYGSTEVIPRNDDRDEGEVNAQSFQFGVAFPDLGKEGALGTFSFVVPFDVLDGEEFLASGAGDGGTQFDLEATYFYPVNDNISIVPAFYWIINPNNFEDNPSIYVGNVRLQFSF